MREPDSEQRAILDALPARNAEAAGEALTRHVLASRQRFLVTLDLLIRRHNRPSIWDQGLTVETGTR